MKKIHSYILIYLFTTSLFSGTSIQSIYGQIDNDLNLSDTIPFDPNVRYGRLPNGFSYYIKKNEIPKNKIVMNLTVKAGKLLEEEDQTQMSHLLEHLAFRGTTHFPNGPYDYFQKHGLRGGSDFNANTGFEATNYRVMIPSNSQDLLQGSLRVLRDWCQEILFAPEAIEAERRAVLQEMGYHPSKELRPDLTLQLNTQVCNNARLETVLSRNISRNLIHFNLDALTRYYEDWYRPDLQAVVIIGNVDPDEIENQVRNLFSDLRLPASRREHQNYPVVLDGKKNFITLASEDNQKAEIRIYKKVPYNYLITVRDFKALLLRQLYSKLMDIRIGELFNQYNSPLENGGCKFVERPFISDVGAFYAYTITNDISSLKRSYQALILELERVNAFGFSDGELEIARSSLLAEYLNTSAESHDITDNCIEHFIRGSAVPHPKLKGSLMKDLLMAITLTDINEMAKDAFSDGNKDIIVLGPKSHINILPTEATIAKWTNEVKHMEIKNHKTPPSINDLMKDAELQSTPGATLKVSKINSLNVTILRLANGLSIVLKPFKPEGYKANEILLHGFSPGGFSVYRDADYINAICASDVIANSGVGGFTKFDINRYLKDKRVQITTYIDRTMEGVKASCALGELEIMLQLIYLHFTHPNKTQEAFDDFMRIQNKHQLQKGKINIYDTINSLTMNASSANIKLTKENMNLLQFDRAYDIYRDRFMDADDFTFVLTGDFNLETAIPLLEKYLGAIPSTERKEYAKVVDNHISRGRITKTIKSGAPPEKAFVELRFVGEYNPIEENKVIMRSLNTVLQLLLKERLRKSEGAVYYVTTNVNLGTPKAPQYSFNISFECAPEKYERIISFILEEIESLRQRGPESETITKMMAIEKQAYEKDLTRNQFWLNYLSTKHTANDDLADLLRWPMLINALTQEDLRISAREYLNFENYMRFVLL